MSWDAAYTVRDAIEARFTSSAFDANITTVNTEASTSAPLTGADPQMASGKAVYTIPRTSYVFPCVEVTPPEGYITSHSRSSTTSEVSVWVYVSFRGTEQELDAWALTYLTALTRTFLSDTSASGYEWSPTEFSASPQAQTAEGTYVQAVGVKITAEIAEVI